MRPLWKNWKRFLAACFGVFVLSFILASLNASAVLFWILAIVYTIVAIPWIAQPWKDRE